MIALSVLLAAPLAAAPELEASFQAPSVYVQGEAYVVEAVLTVGDEPAQVPAWLLTPAAFSVGGSPLGERGEATLTLAPGTELATRIDLGPALSVDGDFQLEFARGGEPVEVAAYAKAPEGQDYMQMEPGRLGQHRVLMRTNRGDMVFELYPDVAPNHVRNFLDLVASGFYEGILFHRVSPTFMVQAGDPNTKTNSDPRTWGTGGGPRKVEAEFSDKKHVRGILSAARTQDPDSATSQFFVMVRPNANLDGKYSVFGNLASGHDALDAIANADGTRGPDGTVRPSEPQRIEETHVLVPMEG